MEVDIGITYLTFFWWNSSRSILTNESGMFLKVGRRKEEDVWDIYVQYGNGCIVACVVVLLQHLQDSCKKWHLIAKQLCSLSIPWLENMIWFKTWNQCIMSLVYEYVIWFTWEGYGIWANYFLRLCYSSPL